MSVFDLFAEEYDIWFEKHPFFYQSELKALEKVLPIDKKGLEIGSGTGRFAIPLKVQEGIEPSLSMRRIAEKKGFYAKEGDAYSLPFEKETFDYVLMVTTICFIPEPLKALEEARRVLKKEGSLVIGFIDKNSLLGQKYTQEKEKSRFYRDAIFYSTEELTELLKKANFTDFEYYQTLFSPIEKEIEETLEGYGKGSFVVIKTRKK